MSYLDFSGMQRKYPLLNGKDVSFLNDFFNKEEIREILGEIEKSRKKGFILLVIVGAIVLGVSYFLYNLIGFGAGSGDDDPLATILSFLIGGYFVFAGFVIKNFRSKIKGQVLSKMIKDLDNGIKYSASGGFFKDTIDSILNQTNLIERYDKVDLKEDSIEIIEEEKGYNINGMEFATSKKSTDNKGRTRYYQNNHFYVLKIKFDDPKYRIKNPIKLVAEGTKKSFFLTLLYVIILITFLLFAIYIFDHVAYYYLFGGLFLMVGAFLIYDNIKKNNTNLIKLENIEFENEFKIYSSDEVEARQILTPSFMYRIYDYVNKINNKRRYNLYFHDDYIYVLYYLTKDYLEISFYKSVLKNIEDYIDYYLELKNISELSSDLKLEFYDKEFGRKNIIN